MHLQDTCKFHYKFLEGTLTTCVRMSSLNRAVSYFGISMSAHVVFKWFWLLVQLVIQLDVFKQLGS